MASIEITSIQGVTDLPPSDPLPRANFSVSGTFSLPLVCTHKIVCTVDHPDGTSPSVTIEDPAGGTWSCSFGDLAHTGDAEATVKAELFQVGDPDKLLDSDGPIPFRTTDSLGAKDRAGISLKS